MRMSSNHWLAIVFIVVLDSIVFNTVSDHEADTIKTSGLLQIQTWILIVNIFIHKFYKYNRVSL